MISLDAIAVKVANRDSGLTRDEYYHAQIAIEFIIRVDYKKKVGGIEQKLDRQFLNSIL